MMSPDKPPGVSLTVSGEGVGAHASEGVVNQVFNAVRVLFPTQRARARIQGAFAERIASRITAGDYAFTPEEHAMLALIFAKEARKLENQRAILERAGTFLGQSQVPQLSVGDTSARPQSSTSEDWINRFLTYAEDVSDHTMQELYARIAAGEAREPGSFSINTLFVLQRLDQATLQQFRKLRPLIIQDTLLIPMLRDDFVYEGRDVDYGDILHLASVGLLDLHDAFVSLKDPSSEKVEGHISYGPRQIKLTAQREGDLQKQFWCLTSAGVELARLEPFEFDERHFAALCRYLKKPQPGPVMSSRGAPLGPLEWTEDGQSWTAVVDDGDATRAV